MNTKKIVLSAALMLLPSAAFAADNVGTCGWGSKLLEGKSGPVYQVLAVTTNGTSGSQTFGISSGTSGCTQEGVVRSNWVAAAFIDGNMDNLARDISRGEGENLKTLASALNVKPEDHGAFAEVLQKNFSEIYSRSDVSSAEVTTAIRSVLANDAVLAQYATKV